MNDSADMLSGANKHAARAALRMSNPLQRMRRERRVALLVFNALLLAAALMQLFGLGLSGPRIEEAHPPPALMEFDE